jgi:hypothetical protein
MDQRAAQQVSECAAIKKHFETVDDYQCRKATAALE